MDTWCWSWRRTVRWIAATASCRSIWRTIPGSRCTPTTPTPSTSLTGAASHARARAARRHGRTCRFAGFRPDDRDSRELVEFCASRDGLLLELKTKTDEIENLLAIDSARADAGVLELVAAARFLNSEKRTAAPAARLAAARRVLEAGYKVGFHLDPVIAYPDAERDYLALLDDLFDTISPARIAFISLGGLRMTPALRSAARRRHPHDPAAVRRRGARARRALSHLHAAPREPAAHAGAAYSRRQSDNHALSVHGAAKYPSARVRPCARARSGAGRGAGGALMAMRGGNGRGGRGTLGRTGGEAPPVRPRVPRVPRPPRRAAPRGSGASAAAETAAALAPNNGNARLAGRARRASRAAADTRARPVGVFDSGIGGLTVLKALSRVVAARGFHLPGRHRAAALWHQVATRSSSSIHARIRASCSPKASRCWWSRATRRARWRWKRSRAKPWSR